MSRDINLRALKEKAAAQATGSLTIEAALSLSLFVFAVICLAMPLKMLDTQRKVQMVLESFSREMSQYAYIRYRLQEGEELGEGSEAAGSLFSQAAAGVYLRGEIERAVGRGRVERMDFSKTAISEDGSQIDLKVEYRLKLPFSVFRLDSVPAFSRSCRRGWIGSDGGRQKHSDEDVEDGPMVYVGNSMGRYHWFSDCHYISNDISPVPYEEVNKRISAGGARYKACSVCGGQKTEGNIVYIMPNGKYYHRDPNCSSIAFYVRKVPLREVEYLGECSYCGGKGGER